MIKYFDIFAGIGGFRSGLEKAGGFECVGYCEIDRYAKKAYETMYDTEGEVYYDDARKINPNELPDFDLICGGFPCQSFSIAGKRGGFDDARGTLFFEIARIAAVKKPKYLLLENVPGLLSHDSGRTFATILGSLDELGYDVAWQVLNSANFRVAQSRKRVFIIGFLREKCAGKVLSFTDANPKTLVQRIATDQRPDKKKLETIFGNYKTGLSLVDAMKKKIVAEANVYRIETNLDLSHIRFNGKDYINADLEKSIRVKSRNELIAVVLHNYFSEGKVGQLQGVVFCVNTNHAQEMERVLNAKGLSAKAYTRKTKNPDEVMQQFREKKIRFLCACEMISEGWDYPELGILVMARPTLSKVLYMQQIGRGLRRTNTKTNVFVIDVVDEYGAMAKPCSMHSIFSNPFYTAFGSILKRDYSVGDMIEVDGRTMLFL